MAARARTVIAFGVFDLLHPGHLRFLRAAKRLGGRLTVVVTRDASAQKEKGRRPVLRERERLEMVGALQSVDRAVLGDAGAPTVVRRLRPDVIAVGYDQDPRHPKLLAQLGALRRRPRVVRIPPHLPSRFHSKLLRKSHVRP